MIQAGCTAAYEPGAAVTDVPAVLDSFCRLLTRAVTVPAELGHFLRSSVISDAVQLMHCDRTYSKLGQRNLCTVPGDALLQRDAQHRLHLGKETTATSHIYNKPDVTGARN